VKAEIKPPPNPQKEIKIMICDIISAIVMSKKSIALDLIEDKMYMMWSQIEDKIGIDLFDIMVSYILSNPKRLRAYFPRQGNKYLLCRQVWPPI
jgi:hypothetical protein